jgi:hypothetical protein
MVNARRLDDIDGPALKPTHFFGGRCWEDAQHKRIVNGGHISATDSNGAAVSGRRLRTPRAIERWMWATTPLNVRPTPDDPSC